MGPLANLNPGFRAFLDRMAHSPGTYRLVARNFLLDEGIAPERAESYGESGGASDHTGKADWRQRHEEYLQEKVYVPMPDDGVPATLEATDADPCPETFRHPVSPSPFRASHGGLHLVRAEELSFVAHHGGISPDRLKDIAQGVITHGPSSPDAPELDAALRKFSRSIDVRPVFSAFWEDLADLFGDEPAQDPDDWPDRLRDRLGLAHHDPGQCAGPIELLIFRYEVDALSQILGPGEIGRPLLPPSVLDRGFSDAFYPALRGAKTGHTLNLMGEHHRPQREVVHPTVAFGARNLWRVGAVVTPAPEDLLTPRALHLLWLQKAAEATDYGADVDGDLL